MDIPNSVETMTTILRYAMQRIKHHSYFPINIPSTKRQYYHTHTHVGNRINTRMLST